MQHARSAASGALWSALAGIVNQTLSLTVFIILARLLDPQAYGLIAVSMAIILLLSAIAGLGLEKLLVQLEQTRQTDTDTTFLLAITSATLIACVLWCAAPGIARLVGIEELTTIVRSLLPLLLCKSLEVVPRGVMVRAFRFRAIALRSIFALTAGGIAGIGMALNGYGVWSLVGQELVKAVISAAVFWWACDWRPARTASLKSATALLRTSLYFMGSELTRIAQHHLDRLLIGSFLGVISLGTYTIAAKVNRIAISILQESLVSVGLPTFSRLRSDPERLATTFYQSQRLSAALTLPAFVLLILTAEPLVQLVLGAQWMASVPLLQALCLASCAICIGLFNTPLLQAVGRSDIALRLSIFSIVTAIAAFFLARYWGVLAVSLAFAVRTWLLLPLELHLVQRFALVPGRPVWAGLLRQLLSLLPMVAAVYGFQTVTTGWPAWPQLLCTLILGALIYLIALALVDRNVLRQLAGIPHMLLSREK